MSNEDARLHGRGGGVEECDRERAREFMAWIESDQAGEADDDDVMELFAGWFARHRLASNPEPDSKKPAPFGTGLNDVGICDPSTEPNGSIPEMTALKKYPCPTCGQMTLNPDNPSPEPEDAEVRDAVALFESGENMDPDVHQAGHTLIAALRSQAGQGRVVTPAQMKAIVEKRGIVADDGSLTFDGEAMAADVNALLAAQEKAK